MFSHHAEPPPFPLRDGEQQQQQVQQQQRRRVHFDPEHYLKLSLAKSLDETRESALRSASKEVDRCLREDEKSQSLTASRGLNGREAAEQLFSFRRAAHQPIPQTILQHYDDCEYKSFMGILPEINRAWITFDSKLLLWKYDDSRDFNVWDGLDQVIVSVGLVVPKRGVFVEDVTHLLVLATPVEVVVLAVVFRDGDVNSRLELQATSLSIPSDEVNMLQITGTLDGRIFMCGSDGNLYELEYQSPGSWFSRKCRKRNHTQSVLNSFLPQFLTFYSPDPIVQLALDEDRKILYALTEASAIQVFWLGSDGTQLSHVTTRSNLLSDPVVRSRIASTKGNTVVGIHVINRVESASLNLLAVTSNGSRLYFSTRTGSGERPGTLEVVHCDVPFPQMRNKDATVHHTYFAWGCLLVAADQQGSSDDGLLALRLESNAKARRSAADEHASVISVSGKAYAMGEAALPSAVEDAMRHRDIPRINVANELSSQHMLASRQFLVLTNNGLYTVQKLRPVDQLVELMEQSQGAESNQIAAFMRRYGEVEVCTMFLMLACNGTALSPAAAVAAANAAGGAAGSTRVGSGGAHGDAARSPGSMQTASMLFPSSRKLGEWAANFYLAYGSEAARGGHGNVAGGAGGGGGLHTTTINNNNNINLNNSNANMMGRRYGMGMPPMAIGGYGAAYSVRYRAFSVYLARLLRPVWRLSINHITFYEKAEVEAMRDALRNLLVFMRSINAGGGATSALRGASSSQMAMRAIQKLRDPPPQEQDLMQHMVLLLSRSVEALSFLIIVNEYDVSILDRVIAEHSMSAIRFYAFATERVGVQVTTQLIQTLMQHCTDQSERLSMELSKHCPLFFNETDRLHFSAVKWLSQAKLAENSAYQREEALQRSLEIFRKIAGGLSFRDIFQIVDEMKAQHFYVGVVELCLLAAESSAHKSSADFDNRQMCYRIITDEFAHLLSSSTDERARERSHQTYRELKKMVLERDDAELQRYVYSWYLEQGWREELLEIEGPFLEKLLEKMDLEFLAEYYTKNNRFLDASRTYVKLADSESTATLAERRYYLGHALALIKQADVRAVGDEETKRVSEKEEVAQLQSRIHKELVTRRAAMAVDDERRAALDVAIQELDRKLFNISQLFNDFAWPWCLWESCLSIIYVANHLRGERSLVERVWENIAEEEYVKAKRTTEFKVKKANLSSIMKSVARDTNLSLNVFPVDKLCKLMEEKSYEWRESAGFSPTWLVELFLSLDVTLSALYDVYLSLFNDSDNDRMMQLHLSRPLRWLVRESLKPRAARLNQLENKRLPVAVNGIILRLKEMPSARGEVQEWERLEREIKAKFMRR